MRASSVPERKWRGVALLLVFLLLTVAWAPAQQVDDGQVPSTIVATQLHIFVTRSGNGLQIIEYYLISNMGEQVYEGVEDAQSGERVTISFSLPDGAEGLRFDGPGLGERFLEVEGGFADTEPIPPGTATVEVFFAYELPYREGMSVERTFGLPVMSVVLVIAEEGLALEGAALTPAGVLDTQMGPALSYTAGPLLAGEFLTFRVITGQPLAPPAPVRNDNQEVAIGLVAVAAALGLGYLLWRAPSPGLCPAEVRPLVEEIAALDETFETGQVGEGTYRQKRDALKRRVRAVLGKAASRR